ncbi:MAG: bifunctional (p)ppGpp synthetase/guanosine-3',5'-bis(diphosphate) 3'-pyrophosphohydrolase [Clostridia bacterium]|nr:bifunctional (p)ppGpp synthetase/guanosine-3',5'-bis(diphosphate) 3'-pyrophosphohydrolase [Clostridia bacterium]
MTENEIRDKNELVALLLSQKSNYDIKMIEKAYDLCVKSHSGQKRFTNEDYYIHPFNVAKIIVGMGMDSASIMAALLHDVVEDTDTTIEEIEKMFGKEVALLVDGVTKIGRLSFSTKEQQQAENLRKMLIAMGKDIRVIIIKLADRLHNMRTLDAMPDYKQREKAVETLEVFAPIAHRLGIRPVKEELEDLAIKHLDPIAYSEIEQLLQTRKQQREQILDDVKQKIEEYLRKEMPNVDFAFQGRVKSVHGIYRKMFLQGKDFDEIYDVYAIRIITDTVADCYNVLGIMHDIFQPIPNRFKDYIATPKPNMYQSLHTTVISRDGLTFEIQIRTFDMHHTAEFGIAAHWKYKEGISSNDDKLENRLAWIRQILEAQDTSEDSSELLQTIKVDLSQEDIFAVTPNGDVISLPVGSTVVDFAFMIHSAVGTRMVGAKADGKIVPINHEIKTGEVIEILTTNQAGHGPSRDWMSIAVTNQAKSKIRAWFKKERRPENIEEGKDSFDKELRRIGINVSEEEYEAIVGEVAKRYHFPNNDDFFAAIGYGGILLSKIMPRIRDDYFKKVQASKPIQVVEIPEKQSSTGGVVVEGIDNCLIKLSKCCAPLPGDEIIGFITRGHGVSIHKRDCTNVPKDISKSEEPKRWISAHWNTKKTNKFTSTLQIDSIDRDNLIVDIMNVISNMRISLNSINAKQAKGGNCKIIITISCESVEHLKSIINHLEKISGVFSVERIGQ